MSFLYNAPSYTANKSGFALDNGAGANQGYYMGMTASGVFGVATVVNGSGTVLGTAAETISFNTTYFIVVKFEQKSCGGTYYKSGSIWINPTPGGSEPAASGTFTGTYTAMNKIQDFLTALGGSAVITDEIRLGTTWADVTPANGAAPPATPTGLQVDSSGDNTVSLSWTAGHRQPDQLQREARDLQRRDVHDRWHHDGPHGHLYRFRDRWRDLLVCGIGGERGRRERRQ